MKVLQTTNLGKGLAGISGSIRYSIYDTQGAQSGSTVNTGVYEMGTDTGIYGVELDMHTGFSGSIVWSVNGNTSVYATEEIKLDQKIVRHMTFGRWEIETDTKQMVFYQDDNVTEIARFDLKDDSDSASYESVFERFKVS